MLVRVNIVGGGEHEPVDYSDDSNTEAVKKDLLGGFGNGILKQRGIGILSDTLVSDIYDYHLTFQQESRTDKSVLFHPVADSF
jgi:hypothetical protein